MSNDRLLEDLARMAKDDREADRSHLDERWDRLSTGELSAEEEAELQALATGSEEMQDAYDAFRPLDTEFQKRVRQTILSSPTTTTEPEPPKILPFRRRAAPFAGLLAAAAALVLVLTRVGGPGEPLPDYVVELEGGPREIRSEDAEAPQQVFATGHRFEFRLRPSIEFSEPIEARFFVGRGSDVLQPWDVDAVIAPTGAVQVTGVLGRDFDLEPGDWTIRTVIGRPGAIPDPDRLRQMLATAEPSDDPGWTWIETRIRVVPPDP